MDRDEQYWTRVLNQARLHLITTGEAAPHHHGPSEEILQSWRRSLEEGADAETLKLPYDTNLNLETRLVRAAEPILTQLHEDLAGSPVSVVLADSRGKILVRRSGEPGLLSRLDEAMLAPGFSYAERFAGTNGIGTALERRAVSKVTAAEHFNESLQEFACVGVPIRDPLTKRVLGVLDITTWSEQSHPAFTPLTLQAARSIEHELLDLAGSGSRALLDEFVIARRGREASVVAVGPHVLLGSADAVRQLGGVARDELWALVSAELGGRDEVVVPLQRGDEEPVQVRIKAVRARRGDLVGGALHLLEQAEEPKLILPTAAPVPLTMPSGLSQIVRGPAALVVDRAAARQPMAIVGERGIGKRSIVERVVNAVFPGRLLAVVEAQQVDTADLAEEVAAGLDAGKPVLVQGAESLEVSAVASVLDVAHGAGGWLSLTFRQPYGAPLDSPGLRHLEAAGVPVAVLPPLRSRTQDLERALPELASRLGGGRVHGLSPALVTRLLREPWPGNYHDVSAVLTEMIGLANGSELSLDDLPEGFGTGLTRQLTPLEWMQRDAIVAALRACDWDKAQAAESLGMSRASIYRKIKSFAIDAEGS